MLNVVINMKSWIKYFVFTCVMLIFSFSKSYAHSWEFKWKEKLPGGVKAKMLSLERSRNTQWTFTLRLIDPIMKDVSLKWGYVTTALDSEDFNRKKINAGKYNNFKSEVLDKADEWAFVTNKAPKKRTYGVRQVIEVEVDAIPKNTERLQEPVDPKNPKKEKVVLNTKKMNLMDKVRGIELYEKPYKYPYEPISVPSNDSEQEQAFEFDWSSQEFQPKDKPAANGKVTYVNVTDFLEEKRLEKERLELEKERLEKERLEKERLEKERLDKLFGNYDLESVVNDIRKEVVGVSDGKGGERVSDLSILYENTIFVKIKSDIDPSQYSILSASQKWCYAIGKALLSKKSILNYFGINYLEIRVIGPSGSYSDARCTL